MITIGNSEISSIFYGNREISAVYRGSTLIWQKQAPPEPSSKLVYAMLSGTGAYAQYNGLWEVVDSQFGPALKKADSALTGNLNDYSWVYFTKVWPGAMSYSEEVTAFLSKSVSNRKDCIAYAYECGRSLPVTLSAQSGVYDRIRCDSKHSLLV